LRRVCDALAEGNHLREALDACTLTTEIQPLVWNSWYGLGLAQKALNMHNERYFAGVINQVTGSPGKILDYIRVVAYFTDGTKKYSSSVIVHLTDDWKGVVSNTLTILPGKEIEQMALQATVENPEAMTFYTDNVWVVEI